MKLDFTKILRSTSAVSAWLLQNQSVYWSKQAYLFTRSQMQWSLAPASAEIVRPILVIARDCYQEFSKSYPVAGLRELKAVLANEYAAKPAVKHLIAPLKDGQRRVVSYVFDAAVAAQAQRAWLVLPESMLLWSAKTTDAVLLVQTQQPYFVDLTSSLPVSLKKNPVIQTALAFAASVGINATALQELTLQSEQLPEWLAAGFQRALSNPDIAAFGQMPGGLLQAAHLKPVAWLAAVTLLLYLGASSAYLTWGIAQRQASIAALGSDVAALLDTQQLAEQRSTELNKYAQEQQVRLFSGHVWLVVQQLIAQEPSFELNSLNSEDASIVLRGKVTNATDMLAAIQANPLVSQARFSAPVTKEADKEAFVVSLVLRQQSQSSAGDVDAE